MLAAALLAQAPGLVVVALAVLALPKVLRVDLAAEELVELLSRQSFSAAMAGSTT